MGHGHDTVGIKFVAMGTSGALGTSPHNGLINHTTASRTHNGQKPPFAMRRGLFKKTAGQVGVIAMPLNVYLKRMKYFSMEECSTSGTFSK